MGEGTRVQRAGEHRESRLEHEVRDGQVVQVETDPVRGTEQPLVRREKIGWPVQQPAREDDPAPGPAEHDRVERGRGERAREQAGQVMRIERHGAPSAPEAEDDFQPVRTVAGEGQGQHGNARVARLERERDGDVAGVHVSAGGGCASRRS